MKDNLDYYLKYPGVKKEDVVNREAEVRSSTLRTCSGVPFFQPLPTASRGPISARNRALQATGVALGHRGDGGGPRGLPRVRGAVPLRLREAVRHGLVPGLCHGSGKYGHRVV